MKKCLLLLGLLLATTIVCPAQKKEKAVNIFEEAGTRDKEPAFQVFVMPQIADVQFLSTEKETFGPSSIFRLCLFYEYLFLMSKNQAVFIHRG